MLKLADESDLVVPDVLALVVPLAAEEMTRVEVWDKFANVVLSNEHKMMADMFQSCSTLAWAFSKVEYKGAYASQFWYMIERIYTTEINHLRGSQFRPAHHSSTVLSSVAMALKYNQSDKLSEHFWANLSETIKLFLTNLPEDPNFAQLKEDTNFKESLNLIHTSIEANPKLD